jgi:uncharacterized membrane protein YfcA
MCFVGDMSCLWRVFERSFAETPVLYVQLLLFGAAIGVISGMLGIGGGIVLVPGLMLLFGFSQQEAQGTSLAALIPPIGIFAAMVYYQNGYVKIPVAGAVAAGFMFGALGGALLLPRVPIQSLRLAFGGLLLYLGLSFVFFGFPPKGIRMAALPAGVAAVLVAVGAWLRGKWGPPRARLPSPDANTEYHI